MRGPSSQHHVPCACGIVVLLACSLASSAAAQADTLKPLPAGAAAIASYPKTGQPLPPFRYRTLRGNVVTNESLGGEPAVLVLWSLGCPGAQRIVDTLPYLGGQVEAMGARLVVVSLDTARAAVSEALGPTASAVEVALADSALDVFANPDTRARYRPEVPMALVVPSLVLLDAGGVVRHAGDWSTVESILQLVAGLEANAEP